MTAQYNDLIKKLDDFIKRYYKNQIVRGLILTILIFVLYITSLTFLEYFNHFSVEIRTGIFYFTLTAFLAVFVKFILLPVLHFVNIGKVINHAQAARIISSHFTEIQDKLLNTLELAQLSQKETISQDLLLASIEQKILDIKPFPFKNAINFNESKKYGKYLLAVFIVFGTLFFFAPNVFTESSKRLVNYQTHFEEAAPFRFIILNDSLNLQKGTDFELKIKVEGEYIPNNVFINYGGNEFILNKEKTTEFSYKFKNVNNEINFYLTAENFKSQFYSLQVLPSPVVLSFTVNLDVPEYTGEYDQTFNNIGELNIPAGTKVRWKFATANIDSLIMIFNDSISENATADSGAFFINRTCKRSENYTITVLNKYFKNENILSYKINVIPDLYPTIDIFTLQDSINRSIVYFNGNVTDDYGFKNLTFNYFYTKNPEKIITLPLELNKNVTTYEFFYAFNFADLIKEEAGDINYYFEVWDNDAVNGSKSARSTKYEYTIPSVKEIEEMTERISDDVQNKVEVSKQLVSDIQENIKKLQENLINNNSSEWERTNLMNDIVKKQMDLEKLIEELKKENENKNEMQNEFMEVDPELLEKQKQIEELMENLITDEIRELMEKIKELQENFDQQELNNMMKEMEFSYEDFEEQLDRNLELLKRYEVEQKLNNTIEGLQELAEKEMELSEMTDNKELTNEELTEKQQEIQEEFEDLMQDYEEATQQNDSLRRPMDLEDFQQQQQQIQQEMNQSQQNLQNNKNSKASESQKKSSQGMSQMAQEMQEMMEKNSMKQHTEDMNDLRQILDNIIRFSFDQEKLEKNLRGLTRTDPRYVDVSSKQAAIKENFQVINDSILALAQRTPEISTYVNKSVNDIQVNLIAAETNIAERYTSQASMNQLLVMKNANDLALLLSEVLESMQQSASSSSSSGEGEPKPGQPGQSVPSIEQMQQQQQGLKQMLENMLQMMQQGGQQPMNQPGMNQQLSEMMGRQQMFNQMLRDLMQNGGVGGETQQLLQEIQNLVQQNEMDIVNRNITPQTVTRQQQIMTRLLEAENAERERELDEKREAEHAGEYEISNPESIFLDKKPEDIFRENLNSTDLKLQNYYKEKFRSYIMRINQ